MKKIYIIALFTLLLSVCAFSQQQINDQRTLDTKIAGILTRLPAQNANDLDKIVSELTALGEPAITNIATRLVPPGQGDDVASRYVISGLVKYLAKGADNGQMKICATALCKSIENAKDEEVKDFLLQELQYVAGDEATATATGYLSDQRLCDPATRVLVRINSDSSKKALMEALAKAEIPQQVILSEALGKTRYVPATEGLTALATSSDQNLRKTVLRSLAEIGDFSSATLLESAAEKAGYTFEPTDAVASYLLFLKRTAENGNQSFAAKVCKKMIEDQSVPNYTKSGALRLLTETTKENAIPVLLQELQSTDKSYRVAVQALLGSMYSNKLAATLKKKIKTTKNAELQSELIYLLAAKNDKAALPLAFQLLQSKDKQVQLAAIQAAVQIGQAKAIVPLIEVLKTGDSEIIATVKTALLTIEGEKVVDAAASSIPQASGAARCALIEIIAQRRADRYAGLLFKEAGNSDPMVRLAAAKALSSVVKSGDEEKIAGLLNNAKEENEISMLQDAMFVAVSSSGNQKEQATIILKMMKQAGDQQSRYDQILAKIGGKEALAVVEKEFENGNQDQKDAAMKALSNWSDGTALNTLYRISKNNPTGNIHDTALASYLSGINKSDQPTDQKVLMFRKAMELANTTDQKKLILKGLSQNSTLHSLIFVSQYLDDTDLQQTAVQAVNRIILANNGLYGPIVEEIAKKAMTLNKDAEADYQKPALLKHMALLPTENGFVSMFNGKDLTGWKGLVENPIVRAKMEPKKLAEEQKKADERMRRDWKVQNNVLVFEGSGFDNLCSEKMYQDFELTLDWRMEAKGDGGVYLRGSPQVQTWDTSRVEVGAQVGSGGLYNNQKNTSKPLVVADNPINEWNTFRIKMTGEKVTVYLNGLLVVDNVTLENYWDRNIPIFDKESIELQAHGTRLEFRDIYVREIPRQP